MPHKLGMPDTVLGKASTLLLGMCFLLVKTDCTVFLYL